MTSSEFLVFYPQFGTVIPEAVLEAYTASAGLRFGDFAEDAEEARRLYVAHKLTLYARTMPAESSTSSFSVLASSGDGTKITGKRVDDVSVTYASGASSFSASSGLADLPETVYGLQLLALLRLHSCPLYIP